MNSIQDLTTILKKDDGNITKWFTYDVGEDASFELHLRMLHPRKFRDLTQRHTREVFNRRTRGMAEKMNADAAAAEIRQTSVLDWRGMTLGILRKLALVESQEDGSTELVFNQKNLEALLDVAPDIGVFIIQTVTNPAAFAEHTPEEQEKNL